MTTHNMQRLWGWLDRYWPVATAVLLVAAGSIAVYVQIGIDETTFLAILIPATLGLFGSFGLYLKRNADAERRLRKALRSELEGMTLFQLWPTADGTVPSIDVFATSVYDQNADSIGLLTEQEITHIVEFYSRVYATKNVLGFHREKTIRANTTPLGQDVGKGDRVEGIVTQLDMLTLSHQRALLTLQRHMRQSNVQNAPELASGTIISNGYPVINRNIALCIEYGLLEREAETELRVTEQGAAFLDGEMTANKLEKQRDVLGRDKGWRDRLKDSIAGLTGNGET